MNIIEGVSLDYPDSNGEGGKRKEKVSGARDRVIEQEERRDCAVSYTLWGIH